MPPDAYGGRRDRRDERKRPRSPSPSEDGPRRPVNRRRADSRDRRRDRSPERFNPNSNARSTVNGVVSAAPQRKRPGQGARLTQAQKDAAAAAAQKRREDEEARERERLEQSRRQGIGEAVKEHYNMVPERGRDWRRTESKIKGLRNYNNWVKSCLIQKFSASEDATPGARDEDAEGGGRRRYADQISVLDIGCGKGGDLTKWQKAPQRVRLYVGIDPANVSIQQARDRYNEAKGRARGKIFHAEFYARDGFGEWVGEIPIVQQVGIDPHVGPGGNPRWGGGGFDVVTMMFCMHYALESEEKARGMLKNVAGSLKKGGRFIGAVPSSDVIRDNIERFYKDWDKKYQAQKKAAEKAGGQTDGKVGGAQGPSEADDDGGDSPGFVPGSPVFAPDSPPFVPDSPTADEGQANGETAEGKAKDDDGAVGEPVDEEPEPQWGNSLYNVRFPRKTPKDGIFRPPFGWKYTYFLHEAVEAPEYIVPFEAFRALAEEYSLEMTYRKPFLEVWDDERDDPELGRLSARMGVTDGQGGSLKMTDEEREAASFYLAFCFVKL